jgi:porphobilinogen deaminase|tara:strand:+ start:2913 stop:4067 length:1155 start_codon:yes stop_codon:yes gene_type:complete
MEEKPRLEVLTTPSNYDGVRLQVENLIVKNRDSFNFKMTELPHMEVAIESLKSGTADMLAMSIEQWKSLDVEGLKISAFLPRREPTWVLVGDDKPEYLPLNATVICPKKLIKRQLIRMRPDLLVYDLREFLELEKLSLDSEVVDDGGGLELLEKLRNDGLIDGYVISRGQFSQIKSRVRRHTLGMQREKPSQEFERSTFISPPLEGFTVLVSREGFPISVVKNLNDTAAETCYTVENAIFESLSDELKEICGVFVEQKKLSTILKQYVKLIDDSYALKIGENYLIPSKKKTRDLRTKWNPSRNIIQGPRICIYFELLSKNSNVSLELVRIEPILENRYDRGKNVLIQEIKFLVELLQQDHDELKRLINGLPEEYRLARSGLLEL